MRRVLLSLDREALPVQFGVTAGSSIARFFSYALGAVGDATKAAPYDAAGVEVEIEQGTFFTHHEATPSTCDLGADTRWVREQSGVDWVEVTQMSPEGDERAVILRIRSDINTGETYFAATTSEEFLTMLMLRYAPG